jgi:cyclopropane fatty-acyl-phospholipid synthase-like methyltransferase
MLNYGPGEGMTNDYRQRIYKSYMRSSPHYYQKMVPLEIYEAFRPFYRRNYLEWLPKDRHSRVIDVGCGAGHCLYFLQKEGFDNSEGLDTSQEMVNQCQAQGLSKVRLGGWREFLSIQPETYGTIIANDFLEHLTKEEILEFLDMVLIALQPGGRLILKVPNAYTIFGSRDAYIDFTHQLSFTPQSMLQVLIAVGFSTIRILPVYAPIQGVKSAIRRALWEVAFMPVLRAWSFMSDGERQPAIYTVNLLAVADKP